VFRFVAVTIAVSLVLSALLMTANWKTSQPFWMGLTTVMLVMVPAWSMIIGAVGAPLDRKLRFVLGALLFIVVFDLLAFATGWQQMATSALAAQGAGQRVARATYKTVLISSPFVVVLLFARKRPSVFWSADERG
jgi:hypothetical protein